MAEVHVIGQISHAKDFPVQSLFCKWMIQCGNNWKLVSGKKEGQTQVSSSPYDEICGWYFPIDVQFATTGIQGWPKIYIQVFHLDWVGRSHLFGYGSINIPSCSGSFNVDCYTWRPYGSFKDRFVQYFLGGGLQLKNPAEVFSSVDRYQLNTESMGIVTFDLTVILRNFSKFGVEYK